MRTPATARDILTLWLRVTSTPVHEKLFTAHASVQAPFHTVIMSAKIVGSLQSTLSKLNGMFFFLFLFFFLYLFCRFVKQDWAFVMLYFFPGLHQKKSNN